MYDETATDESVSAFENDKHEIRVNVYQIVIDTASRQIDVRLGDLNEIIQDASYLIIFRRCYQFLVHIIIY